MRTKQTLLVEETGGGRWRFVAALAAPISVEHSDKQTTLKEQIAANLASEFAGALNSKLIRQVINEADALAATTPFPALFLPTLAEEKLRNASAWAARQQAIRERSQSWSLALAA